MFSLLLRKALPFTLTFVVGTALGGLTRPFGGSGKKTEPVLFTRTYDYGGRCRMGSHKLVAESKPLVILFRPDARLPREFGDGSFRNPPRSALVRVTFGADGKVRAVEPFYENSFRLDRLPLTPREGPFKEAWGNVERAARRIQFTPETVDSVPVSVTKELEIFFFRD
jgi:hypothetical protein